MSTIIYTNGFTRILSENSSIMSLTLTHSTYVDTKTPLFCSLEFFFRTGKCSSLTKFNQELQSTLISNSSFKIIHTYYGNIITPNYSMYDHKIQYFSEWHSNSLLRTIKNQPLHVTNIIHSKQYVFTVTLVGKLSHKSLYVTHTVTYFYETEFEVWAVG